MAAKLALTVRVRKEENGGNFWIMELQLEDNFIKAFNRRIIFLEAQAEKENVAKSLHDISNRLNSLENRLANVEGVSQRLSELEDFIKSVIPRIQVRVENEGTINGHQNLAGSSSAFVNASFIREESDGTNLRQVKGNTSSLSGK